MDDIDLNDYIAAGYTLVKDVDRKYWHDEQLVPDRIISLSSCLGVQFDVVWTWNPTKYSDDIQAFGIPKNRFDGFENFNKLVWKQNDPGDPLIYSSLNFAQELARNFITDYSALHMIGIAIHRERALSEWPRHNPGDRKV